MEGAFRLLTVITSRFVLGRPFFTPFRYLLNRPPLQGLQRCMIPHPLRFLACFPDFVPQWRLYKHNASPIILSASGHCVKAHSPTWPISA
ncbi:hypothetical protein BDR07DRAFT_701998 [Suillus spraguei]|nr:hypothetical protein BDR07DRAFT_701998 [Suillus spraguei]